MRESMPGRPAVQREQYQPDEARPPSELDRLYDRAAIFRQMMIDNPPEPPDEFAVAARKVADREKRRRGPEWHRARMKLGG